MAHILCVKRAIHRCNVSVYQQYTLWHEKIATYTRFPSRCRTPCHDGTGEKYTHSHSVVGFFLALSLSAQLLLFLCSTRRSLLFADAIKPLTHTHTSFHSPNPFAYHTTRQIHTQSQAKEIYCCTQNL